MKEPILSLAKKRPVIFDGAMGTMLQNAGLKIGQLPETLNILSPDTVASVHRAYIEAGADVITTNTFGCNDIKLAKCEYTTEEIARAAVKIAKSASDENTYVAFDVGPTGAMLEPLGSLSFEDAVGIFKRAIKAAADAGADLVLIETMSDLSEARAAAIASKEVCDLPVFVTMSFQDNMRTFMGVSASCAALALSPLADAIGINCSLGPKEVFAIAEDMSKYTNKPLIIQPNAGMPRMDGDKTVFDVSPSEFASFAPLFVSLGAAYLGGCCGTTPEHIRKLKEACLGLVPEADKAVISAVCSSTKTIKLDRKTVVIGERINPTGKKLMKAALLSGDVDYILRQATEQTDAGADVLDINVGVPGIDEKSVMLNTVKAVQSVSSLPLQIDSSDPATVEAALRFYPGKAIVNSVNGSEESLAAMLPVVKKYGAALVALCVDEKGVPKSKDERVVIAKRIIERALNIGIPLSDILVDCLTLTVGAQQDQVKETLGAIVELKREYGVKCVLGVSNVSFGLPNRELVNKTFLAEALACGLDAAIINPNVASMMDTVRAHNVLAGYDEQANDYITYYSTAPESSPAAIPASANDMDLTQIIIKGMKNEAPQKVKAMLDLGDDPMKIVSDTVIPALDVVGSNYEQGKIFLPQLIRSAETVQAGVEVIKERLGRTSTNISKGKIVLATVKGDVHDIGKNIVKVILENYGYDVIDLGRDVPPEKILAAAKDNNVKLVGLSALMITTVKYMEETIKLIHKEMPDTKVVVGGAVLTKDYADSIGADFYGKDASATAAIAKLVFAE